MKKQNTVDYGNVPITKLPPGRAYGAGDLQQWSMNRAVGASGVAANKTVGAVMLCPKCKKITEIIISQYDRRDRKGQTCRHCGKKGLKLIKRKRTAP